jgi:UTP--glucose-1-phosphate uridylyltransferase
MKMKVRKAVIPAAGFGTRFLPATISQPKEMLAVIDKPLILYCVEEIKGAGINEIAIITNRGKSSLKDYFNRNPELEEFLREKRKFDLLEEVQKIAKLAEFSFIRQPRALGLGHAILMAEKFVGGEPFAVLLPDDIYDSPTPCIKQLMDVFYELKGVVIALGKVRREETKKYGIVKSRPISKRVVQVLDMAEKPGPQRAFSDLGILGRYVFTPEIFEAIKKTPADEKKEIQITDAIKLLLDSQPVYGYLFEGKRYDAGDKLGFLEATIELSLKRPEFRERVRKIIQLKRE